MLNPEAVEPLSVGVPSAINLAGNSFGRKLERLSDLSRRAVPPWRGLSAYNWQLLIAVIGPQEYCVMSDLLPRSAQNIVWVVRPVAML